MISNHNDLIKPKDIVIHLGDFIFFRETIDFMKIFNRLNGKFIVFKGNHDKLFHKNHKGKKIFEFFMDYHPSGQGELKIRNEKFHFNHYPCLSWNASCHGRLHFFGHVHSSPNKIVRHMPNSYDCGVDNNNYRPIHLDEAIQKAKDFDPGTLKFGE